MDNPLPIRPCKKNALQDNQISKLQKVWWKHTHTQWQTELHTHADSHTHKPKHIQTHAHTNSHTHPHILSHTHTQIFINGQCLEILWKITFFTSKVENGKHLGLKCKTCVLFNKGSNYFIRAFFRHWPQIVCCNFNHKWLACQMFEYGMGRKNEDDFHFLPLNHTNFEIQIFQLFLIISRTFFKNSFGNI